MLVAHDVELAPQFQGRSAAAHYASGAVTFPTMRSDRRLPMRAAMLIMKPISQRRSDWAWVRPPLTD